MECLRRENLFYHSQWEREPAWENNWPGLSCSFSSLLLCKNSPSSPQSMRSWVRTSEWALPFPQSVTASVLSLDSDAGEGKKRERRNDMHFKATDAYTHGRKQDEDSWGKIGGIRVRKSNQIPACWTPKLALVMSFMNSLELLKWVTIISILTCIKNPI